MSMRLLLLFPALLIPLSSWADDFIPHPCPNPSVQDLRVELHRDSAEIPSPLIKPKPVIPLGCERPFIYKGDVYPTDSPQAQDASTLKYFVKSVPEASTLLADYQKTREKAKISAYTGTIGLVLLVFGPALSRSFFSTAESRGTALTVFQVSGIALAAGGFFYSLSLSRTNEYLIPKAVETYNNAKKEDPIELRFTTGWKF